MSMSKRTENKEIFRPQTKVLQSQDLFSGLREILIEHNQNYYRLSITKAGKLILNK